MTDVRLKFSHPGFELDVNFPLPDKGISGLFGPSGSGKTTLIRCLAGLERPAHGYIKVGDSVWQSEDIFLPAHKRRLGLVFQDVRLFDHLNVKGNLLFGYKRTAVVDRKINVEDVVEMLDLSPLLDKRPDNLSGGEAQRVAIGRALLTSPALLLMDEPLAALGEQHKKDILPYLRKLPQNFGIPLLYVSHDFEEMASLTQYMIILNDGKIRAQGNLLDVATHLPEIMDRWTPDNILEGEMDGPDLFRLADGQVITLPPSSAARQLVINARDITLLQEAPEFHGADALLKGRVEEKIALCDGKNMVRLSLAGQDIHAMLGLRGQNEDWISPGRNIYMMINRLKPHRD